jgi:hypothetical protein
MKLLDPVIVRLPDQTRRTGVDVGESPTISACTQGGLDGTRLGKHQQPKPSFMPQR